MWGTLGSIQNLNIPNDGKPQEEWDLSTFDPIQDISHTIQWYEEKKRKSKDIVQH
jgi:hypothetical protein